LAVQGGVGKARQRSEKPRARRPTSRSTTPS